MAGEGEAHHSSSGCLALTIRKRTPDHPPYSEMVQVALRTMAEEGGSTEVSISSHIQSNYHDLPWGHSKLLPYYLRKLLAAGEISVLSPNRYLLPPSHHPNPNPPQLLSSLRRSTPRAHLRRRRTPNPNPHPLQSRGSSPPGAPRRRGRPPKNPPSGAVDGHLIPHGHPIAAAATPAVRRGRGRPRRIPNANDSIHQKPTSDGEPPSSRPRLILRLQRRKPTDLNPNDAERDATDSSWCCVDGSQQCSALMASSTALPNQDSMQPEPDQWFSRPVA